MRQLEIEKKYTFGLDKTKYMVMDRKRKRRGNHIENIERGMVKKAEEQICKTLVE